MKPDVADDGSEDDSEPHETVDAALDEALDGESADEDELRSLFSEN